MKAQGTDSGWQDNKDRSSGAVTDGRVELSNTPECSRGTGPDVTQVSDGTHPGNVNQQGDIQGTWCT